MKKLFLRLVALLSLAAVCGAFYGLPTAKALIIQPVPTLTFLVVLLLAAVIGRFFCGWVCPLGILQSTVNFIFHPKTHVRRVCSRLPETKAQRFCRWGVFVLAALLISVGFGALGWTLTPYSILGKALIGFVPGIILAALVLVTAAIGSGRFWCNWVCPAGTLFNLLAPHARFPHKINLKAGCGNCRKCFPQKKPASKPVSEGGVTRRETLAGFSLLAATQLAEKTTDGGYAPISLPGIPERPTQVLPPGAVDRPLFNRLCVGCGACIAACPEKCLVPSTALKTFGQPQMDFQKSHCRLACNQKCAAACPAKALRKLDTLSRRDIHMGHAIWRKDRCVRTTEDVPCTACQRKCPVKAITLVDNFPVINKELCIGCGACEHVCPARPLPAIFVKGFERQRLVRPFNIVDLIAEMSALIQHGGAAVVTAKDGVIQTHEEGRGVLPILKLLDEGKLRHTLVVDKVIGRAAAAICIVGGARQVHGLLMSEDAKKLLTQKGITATAGKLVPRILDRKMSGGCPLEATVAEETDPEKMVAALRAFTGSNKK